MKIAKRSVVLDGQKTSITLEDNFWIELKKIARGQNVTVSRLVAQIDSARNQSNLSSAIRIFVLEHLQNETSRIPIAPVR